MGEAFYVAPILFFGGLGNRVELLSQLQKVIGMPRNVRDGCPLTEGLRN